MNEYFKIFQNISQSIEQTLVLDLHSTEIKQSAVKIKESVQPCFEELRQSASRLKELIQVSFAELNYAEDVWNSKPRISQAPTLEIIEQIGELTGHDARIPHVVNQLRDEVVKKNKESWENRIENLRQKWFIDAKSKLLKKGVGWGDKDGFIKDIQPKFNEQLLAINVNISHGLNLAYHHLLDIKTKLNPECITLLEQQAQTELSEQLRLMTSEIERRFVEPIDDVFIKQKIWLTNTANRAIDKLINKWGDISWEEVISFRNKVVEKSEETINTIFNDRIELLSKTITLTISFYNTLLERQARYQQETIEQREAEKAWIDRQRRELEQVQKDIEAILIQSVE